MFFVKIAVVWFVVGDVIFYDVIFYDVILYDVIVRDADEVSVEVDADLGGEAIVSLEHAFVHICRYTVLYTF